MHNELLNAFERLIEEHRALLIKTRVTKRDRDQMERGGADFILAEYLEVVARCRALNNESVAA